MLITPQSHRTFNNSFTLAGMAQEGSDSFARVTMDGKRFDGGRMPVDALEELLRYQKLVVVAAEQEWRDENPGSDLPANFGDQFELALTDIEDGSAVSVLERPPGSLFGEYFDRGRDEVDAELARTTDLQDDLRDLALVHHPEFVAFGSSLHEGEFLAVVHDIAEAPSFKFTPASHQRVAAAAKRNTALSTRRTIEGWIVGRLTEINTEKLSFKIITAAGEEVPGRYKKTPEVLDDLKAALGVSEKHPVIRMLAKQRVEGDTPKLISSVTKVEVLPIDGKPWSRRMIELARLLDGWDDEAADSKMIAFPALESARELMGYVSSEGMSMPGLFPHYEGGVTVEWATPERVFTIEIDSELTYSLFATSGTDITVDESTLDVSKVKDLILGAGLR